MVKRFRYDGDDETIREDADGEWVLAVDYARAREALQTAETVMMIVEPRSHKAEYIQALALIREVLGSVLETASEPDSQCVTTLSGKHWWIKQDDGTLKCQSCNKTSVNRGGVK